MYNAVVKVFSPTAARGPHDAASTMLSPEFKSALSLFPLSAPQAVCITELSVDYILGTPTSKRALPSVKARTMSNVVDGNADGQKGRIPWQERHAPIQLG